MNETHTQRAASQRKGTVNEKDTGRIYDINRVLDAHLYSQQSKGQSDVLTFSAPLELAHPHCCRKCYCNGDDSRTESSESYLNGAGSVYPEWSFREIRSDLTFRR